MSALDAILQRASAAPTRIALAEGEDPRVVEGALRAAREHVALPILVGRKASVAARLRALGAGPNEIPSVDPATSEAHRRYASAYHVLRRHKGVDEESARRAVLDPLTFAAMMVRSGDAEGSIAGAVATTAATVRTALQVIGVAENGTMVSSFFLAFLDAPHHPRREALVFADCALIVQPSVAELAGIATASADSFRRVLGDTPRVALLSFSTAGSARHERVTHVTEAVALARRSRPDLDIDGELQFDAAFVPDVSARKAPGSTLGGRANVLVFPSLEAGNIGYKIAQRIGGVTMIGPVLQGLRRPANDLSRGCSADDVHSLLAVSSLQAADSPPATSLSNRPSGHPQATRT